MPSHGVLGPNLERGWGEHMRLTILVEHYARLTQLHPGTVRLHELAVRQFSKTLIRHATVDDFTEDNLARHVARRLAAGRSRGTVAGEQAKLLALWRFAAKQGHCAIWPVTHPVRVPDRIPRAWTMDELRKLFACTQFATRVGSVDGPLWWRALFLTLYDTGERIEATMLLRWDGVDIEGRSVFMPAETRKGGRVDRLYPIAADTAAALDLLPRDHRPFFWPYHHGTLYNRLKRMLLAVGLPCDRRSKFHRIRRTTASHYEAAGGNATELLGHTSRKVTRGYIDPRICKTTSAIDLLKRPDAVDNGEHGPAQPQ